MAEEEPLRPREAPEPTKVPLSGPNVTTTFGRPPRPDAQRAHDAAIRMHLRKDAAEDGGGEAGDDAAPPAA